MKNYNLKIKNYSDKSFLLVSAYRYAERTISSSTTNFWSQGSTLGLEKGRTLTPYQKLVVVFGV